MAKRPSNRGRAKPGGPSLRSELLGWKNLAWLALVVVAAAIVYAVLSFGSAPFLAGPREGFLALTAIGVLLCALGACEFTRGKCPMMYFLAIVGALTAILIIAFFAGAVLPFIGGEREAFTALALLLTLFVLAHFSRLIMSVTGGNNGKK